MNAGNLQNWLSNLKETINFETVATQVFARLLYGQGSGLLVLYGPSIIANKTYFLNVIEAFQQGCSPIAKDFVSAELWRLLLQLHADTYQCINITSLIEEFRLDPGGTSYRIPLGVTTTVALSIAANVKGLKKEKQVVIICDDLDKFMSYNKESNEQFLVELARILDNRPEITFLAAAQKIKYPYWDAPALLGDGVLNLGWD